MAVAVVFWLTRSNCFQPCVSVEDRILALRIGVLLLAIGAAFVLDDPTDDTLAHLPTKRWVRRTLRAVLALPGVALAWAILVPLAQREPSPDRTPLPTGALTLELVGILVAGFALSALLSPLAPERMGGVGAAPALLLLMVMAFFLPHRIVMLPSSPIEPRWAGAHEAWRWVVAAGVAVFAWASRDPGGRLLVRRSAGRDQLARRAT
jgi:hypothetical protein